MTTCKGQRRPQPPRPPDHLGMEAIRQAVDNRTSRTPNVMDAGKSSPSEHWNVPVLHHSGQTATSVIGQEVHAFWQVEYEVCPRCRAFNIRLAKGIRLRAFQASATYIIDPKEASYARRFLPRCLKSSPKTTTNHAWCSGTVRRPAPLSAAASSRSSCGNTPGEAPGFEQGDR